MIQVGKMGKKRDCTLDEHECFAVASERVLQKESQFAVSEGHVLLLRNQSSNDITQGAQALVDILRLLKAVASCT